MRNCVFEIFEPIGTFEEVLGAKTLLKTGFHSIYNEFLHCIEMKFSRNVWDHDECSYINFQGNSAIRRVIGVRNATRWQY